MAKLGGRDRISRRKLLRLGTVGSLGLAFLGWAKSSAAKIQLRIATPLIHTPSHAKAFQQIKDLFEKKHPDIGVTYYGQAEAAHWNQLATELVTGNPPDLFDIAAQWFVGYSKLGAGYEPLDKYLKDTDILDPKLGINPSLRSTLTMDGSLRAVPYGQASFGWLYWKDRFDAGGVKVEDVQTWDGFHEASKKLTAKGQFAIGPATSADFWGINEWERWAWTIGGGMFSYDQPPYDVSHIAVNNEASAYAAEFMRKMVLDEKLSPGGVIDNAAQYNFFYTKRIAMIQGGSYQIAGVKSANPDAFKDLGLFRLPDAQWNGKTWRPTINIGTRSFAVSAASKNKDAAAEWLKVLGSDEGQMISYQSGNEIAKQSVLMKLPPDSLQRQAAGFNQHYHIVHPNSNARKQEMWNALAPMFQKMWLGQSNVKETLDASYNEIKRILEKK